MADFNFRQTAKFNFLQFSGYIYGRLFTTISSSVHVSSSGHSNSTINHPQSSKRKRHASDKINTVFLSCWSVTVYDHFHRTSDKLYPFTTQPGSQAHTTSIVNAIILFIIAINYLRCPRVTWWESVHGTWYNTLAPIRSRLCQPLCINLRCWLCSRSCKITNTIVMSCSCSAYNSILVAVTIAT